MPNLGVGGKIYVGGAQNSNKRINRIDLRQNLMKNGSRTMNCWYMTGRR
jgi:hypothetical protein